MKIPSVTTPVMRGPTYSCAKRIGQNLLAKFAVLSVKGRLPELAGAFWKAGALKRARQANQAASNGMAMSDLRSIHSGTGRPFSRRNVGLNILP